MKNRLQTLWDQVLPKSGPCPLPDVKAVRRRVDAALDSKPRALHPWRTLRLAALCAAALALLTGAAAGINVLVPPEYNALSAFFQGDTAPWEHLMDFQPVSVRDENYTLTVTSTVADKSRLFYTLTIEAHSDEAWEKLQKQKSESFYDLLSFRSHGSLGIGGEDNSEERTRPDGAGDPGAADPVPSDHRGGVRHRGHQSVPRAVFPVGGRHGQ